MGAALKASTRPHQNVSGCAGAPQPLIGKPTPFVIFWSVIGNNDQQVKVTVRAVVTSGLRAKEVDAVRFVGFRQTLYDACKGTHILCRQVW